MDEGAPGGSTLLEHNERVPVPGELKIHEKRSWKTWQLCAMALAMFLVGLYVESLSHVKPVAAISNSYKLPPPASSGSSVT
ncbi:MAG TPA: hypothetical protein VK386_08745, partial [Acidimicrobiales bacterium]|nr:hypothetical protein [Acidimicrobiales bacterium]